MPELVQTCIFCKQKIDTEVCWCGDYIQNHNPWFTDHASLPMGCRCGYLDEISLVTRLYNLEE